jgi:hypothetical protein
VCRDREHREIGQDPKPDCDRNARRPLEPPGESDGSGEVAGEVNCKLGDQQFPHAEGLRVQARRSAAEEVRLTTVTCS